MKALFVSRLSRNMTHNNNKHIDGIVPKNGMGTLLVG